MDRKSKTKPPKKPLCNNVYLDNKLQYENSRELQPVETDHPLKLQNESNSSEANETLNVEAIKKEIDSVAIDWKLSRNTKECSCSLTLDQISKKVSDSLKVP